MEKIAEKFFQETARIEEMILLAGVLPSQTLTDPLENFLLGADLDEIQGCFGEIPDEILEDRRVGDTNSVCDWLISNKKLGYLVEMATPVKTWLPSGNAEYSWSHFRMTWFYGDTLDEALQKGFAWIKETDSKNKLKAGV